MTSAGSLDLRLDLQPLSPSGTTRGALGGAPSVAPEPLSRALAQEEVWAEARASMARVAEAAARAGSPAQPARSLPPAPPAPLRAADLSLSGDPIPLAGTCTEPREAMAQPSQRPPVLHLVQALPDEPLDERTPPIPPSQVQGISGASSISSGPGLPIAFDLQPTRSSEALAQDFQAMESVTPNVPPLPVAEPREWRHGSDEGLPPQEANLNDAGEVQAVRHPTYGDHPSRVDQNALVQIDASAAVILGPESIGAGNCQGDGIILYGQYTGNLTATKQTLAVMPGAQFHGGTLISAGDMILAGDVGSEDHTVVIQARGHLMIAESARVFATIHFGSISIYAGARINGPIRPIGAEG